jgi:hypothetical protein
VTVTHHGANEHGAAGIFSCCIHGGFSCKKSEKYFIFLMKKLKKEAVFGGDKE